MLEIKYIRQNLSEVQHALHKRGQNAGLDEFIQCDTDRRKILSELEDLRHRRNVVSDQIAGLKKSGQDAEGLIVEMRQVSSRIKDFEKSLTDIQDSIQQILLRLPNIPHASVPVGQDSSDNPVIRRVGELPRFRRRLFPW